jgi:vanillate O-demethylase monooxygenase subunit
MPRIVRDQWYVAAYSDEIGRAPVARTICDEPLVFNRAEDGSVVALADHCCRRCRPPSTTQPIGNDRVACRHRDSTHGHTETRAAALRRRLPHGGPAASYPVVEQDSFVWIWIGDRADADPATIPRAPWLTEAGWATICGRETIPCRYPLVVDNLMDLSYETAYSPGVEAAPSTMQVDEAAGVVRISRHIDDAACPAFFTDSTGLDDRITCRHDIEFFPPCLYRLHGRIASLNHYPPDRYVCGRDAAADPGAFHTETVYALTPETASSVHNFWAVARDFATDDPRVTDFLHTSSHTAVMQDVVALKLVEEFVAEEERGGIAFQDLSISINAGALAARRLITNLDPTVERR